MKLPVNAAAMNAKMAYVRGVRDQPPADQLAQLLRRYELAKAESLIEAGQARIRELGGDAP
jgi:hypothetical protein